MEAFADMLRVGGTTNSLGRAGEVVACARENPVRLDELFACVLDDDAWVRMRAIDSFEKVIRLHPDWATAYTQRLFDELGMSEQASIQWHLAQLFTEIELTDEQQHAAVQWLLARLETTQVDWIVAVNSMKALLYFYAKNGVAKEQLKRVFTVQQSHHSKTVRKKAVEFLDRITN